MRRGPQGQGQGGAEEKQVVAFGQCSPFRVLRRRQAASRNAGLPLEEFVDSFEFCGPAHQDDFAVFPVQQGDLGRVEGFQATDEFPGNSLEDRHCCGARAFAVTRQDAAVALECLGLLQTDISILCDGLGQRPSSNRNGSTGDGLAVDAETERCFFMADIREHAKRRKIEDCSEVAKDHAFGLEHPR